MSIPKGHPWIGGRGRPGGLFTDEVRALLGTLPDAALAEHAGVTEATIRKWRKQSGIAPYCPKCSHPGKGTQTGGRRGRVPAPTRSAAEIMAANPVEFRVRTRVEPE